MEYRDNRMKFLSKIKGLIKARTVFGLATILLCAATPTNAGTIYNVNFSGTDISLSGYINTNALGNLTPVAFDTQIIDFSITATGTAYSQYPFTFTQVNSTWGGVFFGVTTGANVVINLTPTHITLTNPNVAQNNAQNIFLIADGISTNNARENLRIFDGTLGFRTPSPPNKLLLEIIAQPFTIATATPTETVPEPISYQLLGLGLILLFYTQKLRTNTRKNLSHI